MPILIKTCIEEKEYRRKIQIMNQNRIQQQMQQQLQYNEPMQYPYRSKQLLTKTEYKFFLQLKERCDKENYIICPKVRLEDIAEVTTKQNNMKYRGYIRSRHVDFILCDDKLNIKVALELDDYSHKNIEAQKIDNFKNMLFKTINIPLYRVRVANDYEEKINKLFTILQNDNITINQSVQNSNF